MLLASRAPSDTHNIPQFYKATTFERLAPYFQNHIGDLKHCKMEFQFD